MCVQVHTCVWWLEASFQWDSLDAQLERANFLVLFRGWAFLSWPRIHARRTKNLSHKHLPNPSSHGAGAVEDESKHQRKAHINEFPGSGKHREKGCSGIKGQSKGWERWSRSSIGGWSLGVGNGSICKFPLYFLYYILITFDPIYDITIKYISIIFYSFPNSSRILSTLWKFVMLWSLTDETNVVPSLA